MISAYVGACHRQWDEHLQEFAYALRTANHDTTGRTPCELFLGRKILTPCEKLLYVKEQQNKFKTKDINEVVNEVKSNIEKAQKTQKKYYDIKRRESEIKLGDEVLKCKHSLSNLAEGRVAKFNDKFEGPYEVVKIHGNNLTLKKSNNEIVVNVDQVRKYKDRNKSQILKPLMQTQNENGDESQITQTQSLEQTQNENTPPNREKNVVNESENIPESSKTNEIAPATSKVQDRVVNKSQDKKGTKRVREEIKEVETKAKQGRNEQFFRRKTWPKFQKHKIHGKNFQKQTLQKTNWQSGKENTHYKPVQMQNTNTSKLQCETRGQTNYRSKRQLKEPEMPSASRRRITTIKNEGIVPPVLPSYFHRQKRQEPETRTQQPNWRQQHQTRSWRRSEDSMPVTTEAGSYRRRPQKGDYQTEEYRYQRNSMDKNERNQIRCVSSQYSSNKMYKNCKQNCYYQSRNNYVRNRSY